MSTKTALAKASKIIGLKKLAVNLGVTHQAIGYWKKLNMMPDTEYCCKTNHSVKIETLTNGAVKVEDLLGHIPTCVAMERDRIAEKANKIKSED